MGNKRFIWTYENSKEEALKYTTKKEFYTLCGGAYNYVMRNKLLDELCSHMINIGKSNSYWQIKENCLNEALKYKTKNDFQKFSMTCYKYTFKNKWDDELCSHMTQLKKRNNYWTYDRCKEEALKYTSKQDFKRKSNGAYKKTRTNKWFDDLTEHFIISKKPNNYWTQKRCQEEALKYKTKKEFKKNCVSSYDMSDRKGWLDEICSHMEILGNRYKRIIYMFRFSDNYVYIGLTYNSEERYKAHTSKNKNIRKKSPIFKHMEKTGLIPEYKLLSDYIEVEDAIKLEKEMILKYKNDSHYILLNTYRGGAIGGNYKKIN